METQTNEQETKEDVRFLDYRLDQLENNLLKGQERIEKESKENNNEIMKILTEMQKSLSLQNQTLVRHETEINILNSKVDDLKELKSETVKQEELIKKNEENVDAVYTKLSERINTYQRIAFIILGVSITAIGTALFGVILK